MHFYTDNKLEQSTPTPSSVLIGQKISSLFTRQLADKFILATNQENIVFTFPNPEKMSYFILENSKIEGTVTLQANTTNEWTTPAFSEEMNRTEKAYVLFLSNEIEYQYYRLVFDVINRVEVGYIYGGNHRIKLPPMDLISTSTYSTTDISSLSISGQVFGDRGYDFYSQPFRFLNIAEYSEVIRGQAVASRKELIDFWHNHRNSKPFYVVIDESMVMYPPYFVIINSNSIEFTRTKSGRYDVTIPLREVF